MGLLDDFQEYLSRSGRNLGQGATALADWMRPMAQNGIMTYNGILTGYDTPYTGPTDLDAARDHINREPRSNLSRLMEFGSNYMPSGKAPQAVKQAAQAGGHGDTVLAHINPQEAKLLDILSDGKVDGGGRNPVTGLPSFGDADDQDSGGYSGGSGVDSYGGGSGSDSFGGGGYGDGNGIANQGFYSGPISTESLLGTPDGFRADGWGGIGMTQYAPRDTIGRVIQEYFNPSVPQSRYGMPTGMNPGLARTAAGMVAGPVGGLMGIGAAMGRAQSPAQQAASMAHNQALGGVNSTGQDRGSVGGGLMGSGSPADGLFGLPNISPQTGQPEVPAQGGGGTAVVAMPKQDDALMESMKDYVLNGSRPRQVAARGLFGGLL